MMDDVVVVVSHNDSTARYHHFQLFTLPREQSLTNSFDLTSSPSTHPLHNNTKLTHRRLLVQSTFSKVGSIDSRYLYERLINEEKSETNKTKIKARNVQTTL